MKNKIVKETDLSHLDVYVTDSGNWWVIVGDKTIPLGNLNLLNPMYDKSRAERHIGVNAMKIGKIKIKNKYKNKNFDGFESV